MSQSMKKKALFLLPILFGLVVLAIGISSKSGPEQQPPSETARAVRFIEAQKTPVVPRVIGYGAVKPESVWNAVARVKGAVTYVDENFKKGAILLKGTEIIRIDPTDYELAVAQAAANIRSARAQLEELSVTEANTETSLEIEKRVLKLREAEVARKEKLIKRGAASQSTLDQAQRDLLAQGQQIQALTNTLNLVPTQRKVIEEQLAVYEAQLGAAKLDLERTRIVLPFNARIAEANVEPTQHVQQGELMAVADSIQTSEVEAQVPIERFRLATEAASRDEIGPLEESAPDLRERIGLSATIHLHSGDLSLSWPGRFVRISDTVDPKTRTVGVIVAADDTYAKAVPGARPPLVKGMFVQVEVRGQTTEPLSVVPRTAMHGRTVYLVNKENRLEVRPVTVKFVQGNIAIISQGLETGDRVIVSDISPALDGMLLMPTDDAALAGRVLAEAKGEGDVR